MRAHRKCTVRCLPELLNRSGRAVVAPRQWLFHLYSLILATALSPLAPPESWIGLGLIASATRDAAEAVAGLFRNTVQTYTL